jgi:hypothetical protein
LAPYQAATSFGDAQRRAVAENDPYSGFASLGNTGAQDVLSNPSLSLRDKILGAAISGLTGGTFQGLSDSYRARAQDAYTQSVLASLQGNTIERPDVLSPSIFADASNQANIFKLKAAAEEQAAGRSLKNDIIKEYLKGSIESESGRSKALAEAIGKDPKNAAKIISAFKALETGEVPIATEDNPKEEKKDSGLFGSREGIQSKLEASVQRFIDAGATPSAAADLASKAVQADAIRNKVSAEQVQKIKDQAKSLSTMIDKAESGMAMAGQTGGLTGTVKNAGAWIGNIFGSDSANERLAGLAQLDSVRPEVVQAMRAPGAISDYESRMMIGAGPSSDKTPEQNAVILGTMKTTRDNAAQYADFLDTYLAERGDLLGADQNWTEYMKANPINSPNRKPWLEYFTEQSGASVQPPIQGTPTAPTAATPAITPEMALAELQRRGKL